MMNLFKFEATVAEFPFLAECLKIERSESSRSHFDCDEIKVSRIDGDLLARIPHCRGATGSLVGIDDGERFDFILEDRTIMRDAVKNGGDIVHNEAHLDNERWSGETVLEAIHRSDCADNLAFIVKLEYGYEIQDHYSQDNYSLTVYKAAKNCNIVDLIAEAQKSAEAQVKAEASF